MVDWQERITHTTPPAIRTEHDARYRAAAPLVAAAATWCDLGCGNGIAAAAALGDAKPGTVVLADLDPGAVAMAEKNLGVKGATTLEADLSDPAVLEQVRAALLAGDRERVVTCFEVVEHLPSFVPLVELLTGLARDGELTAVLSVPNDAFTGVENPHHVTVWGEAAFGELRDLLPEDAVVARQIELRGSAIVREGEALEAQVAVSAGPEERVPTHFLVAFGPLAGALGSPAAALPADLEAQRAWERQREADASMVGELTEVVRRHSKEFEEWRAYIHELEGKLGLPPSGTPEREAWDAAQQAAGGQAS